MGSEMCIRDSLLGRRGTHGVLALVRSEPGRRYTGEDLSLAEEFARRAALAGENARLYLEAQAWNAMLEERVAERTEALLRASGAEFFGPFWLVLGGCGSAVLAAACPGVGIGLHGVSLAFGLTVLTMAYAIGHISGCHLNPAVSVGLWLGGRFPAAKLAPYVVAQVLGAIAAGAVLYLSLIHLSEPTRPY